MNKISKVLFVDDEEHVRLARRQTLELANYEVVCCASAKKALTYISPQWPGILVTDIKMPGMDGMALLESAIAIDPDLPVIMVTGHGDVSLAVKAMQIGAYDFIEKPCPTDLLLGVIKRASEKRRLVIENRNLRNEINLKNQPRSNFIGRSPAIERLRKILKNVGASQADVLLCGETGAGKELAAKSLHEMSSRRAEKFVAINCAAIPEAIIENELFGHEAGAFTGATQLHAGKFEYANGGTIFLDEIESMPALLQTKLLRVLQERTIERLGSNKSIPINIRVIAATKVDLKEASKNNRFREDLYYRLNVVSIHLPPLRDRIEDIPLLFQRFTTEAGARHQRTVPEIKPALLQELMNRQWEGNVRELKNEAERYVLGLNASSLTDDGQDGSQTWEKTRSLANQVSAFEKAAIIQELTLHKGDIKKTCLTLDVPRQTLYDKINKYNLKRSDFV